MLGVSSDSLLFGYHICSTDLFIIQVLSVYTFLLYNNTLFVFYFLRF